MSCQSTLQLFNIPVTDRTKIKNPNDISSIFGRKNAEGAQKKKVTFTGSLPPSFITNAPTMNWNVCKGSDFK